MTLSDRWSKLDELLDGALDQPPERRAEWLASACEGDEALCREVERLLELALSDDDRLAASGALVGPLWHDVAAYLEGGEDAKPLAPGDRLGSYEILELIGMGGMGAVYRARDPNLHREVAIKALSHTYQKDDSFLRRFEREAKLLATLNHPNIGAIYDLLVVDERPFLVLELVDGPTLADRLDEGPMELPEIVSIACQIAEALEEAHGKDIIHRDLKPGNVKLGTSGRVKVLDFGVAKTTPRLEEGRKPSSGAERSAPTTASGMILGTASYMSPEQARGKTVDKRTDIWAFGCILFEMLSGRRPFGGTTTSDVLAAVLRDDVTWDWLPSSTPAPLVRIVRRCLEKDPRRRLQDMGDARIELEELRQGVSGPQRFAESRVENRSSWALAPLFLVGLALGFAVAAAMFRSSSGRMTPEFAARTSLIIGPEERLWLGISPSLALSPDGSILAYVAGSGGQSRLFLRHIDRFEPSLVLASDGARSPFFSPDGQWVAFFAGGTIRKVPTSGGNPDVVTKVGLQPRGATWTRSGEVVYGEARAPGLFALDANGAEPPRQVTETRSERVEHLWPHAVGDAILFTIRERNEEGRTSETLAVLAMEDGSVRELRAGAQASYVASGHLVYVQDGTLEAIPFDEATLETRGPSVGMEDPVNVYPGGAASLAVSRSGAIAYLPPSNVRASLEWIDERGRFRTLSLPRGTPSWPRVSPDGTRVAVHVGNPGSRDIWILDLDRPGSSRQLTHGGAEFPVWSPDGKRLAYMSRRHRISGLYEIAADGSEPARMILEGEVTKVPLSWSPQGLLAYYAIRSDTQRDVEVVSVEGNEDPAIFVGSPANELAPVFSPDGRWLAYVSDETGRNEVYVRPFPPPGGVVMVSIDGGSEPVWSRNGATLFYRQRDAIMAVPIEASGSELRAGTPEIQLETSLVPNSAGNPLFDTLPDGRGFIAMRSPRGASIDRVHFVTGFDKELRRQAPAER